jgi:hypothetical protein
MRIYLSLTNDVIFCILGIKPVTAFTAIFVCPCKMKSKSFVRRIISNPIVQTLAVYISGSWVIIELIEYLIGHFSLNEKFRGVILIVLLCGLPIALIVAWLLGREQETPDTDYTGEQIQSASDSAGKKAGKLKSILRKPGYTLPGIVLILLLLVFGIRFINFKARIRWATEKALPEIEQFLNMEDYPSAFKLLQKAEKYIPEDSIFKEYASDAMTRLTILTDPPGAEVFIRAYSDTTGGWEMLGRTPIDSLKLPSFTIYQMRMEREAFEPVLAVVSTDLDTVSRKLFEVGTIPPGMVYVEGYSYEWPS